MLWQARDNQKAKCHKEPKVHKDETGIMPESRFALRSFAAKGKSQTIESL